jgi:hypothetical protein
MEVANLWEEISWWPNFQRIGKKKKVNLAPWMEKGV